MNEYVLTIDDIENVIKTHLGHLDSLWPDSEPFGPRKVHIVELIEAMKLRMHQVAQKNLVKSENAFERAARKITNSQRELPRVKDPEPIIEQKSEMQIAHEKRRAERRDRMTP